MIEKLLRSKNVHALLIAYVLIAAGLLFMVQAHPAAAAATRDTLVVGLQNDMVNPNYFDTATNSVWKQYHVEFNFEGLVSHDPDFASYNVLSDPTHTTCPAGTALVAPYPGGVCVDTATGTQVTVFLRNNITFTNGAALTADDVVFTFQTLPWSTYQLSVLNAIWFTAPSYPLWNSTTYGGTCSGAKCLSHVGIEKIDTYTVKFHLAQTYALFFFDTMEVPIIPKSVWTAHMAPWPQLNLSNPSQSLTDSYDNSIDTTWNNIAASTGTGAFMLTSWVHNSGATIDIYANYWGKGQTHVWRSENYPFYPVAVRHIRTVIYGSLDVVSLALQKGDIDTLVWSLTPGFLTQIQSNPAISVAQVTDSGYFYISWNLREKPWGQTAYSLTLRKAMSMAIDKDYIVNTLMGGFGVKGTVPIAISNPLYVNNTASPPAFNVAAGRALLVANGFVDTNGDGFFEAPDGSPIKATILTPPKDYDPVRADAGIMISNNLKAMGLNIDAAPTSFDTIVAKAFVAPVSFDIYILGWSLGDFPETYICAFFCASQDVNLNTGGDNSAGYNNPRVDALIASAITDTDTASRVQKIKDVEGIVVNDLPWNVLYYRKNLNAYRNDAWQGWANYPNGGGIYNPWSISHITPSGTSVPVTGGSLSVALSMPDQVYARENVSLGVAVAAGTAPAAGATVSLKLTYGTTDVWLNGTTDTSGHASFNWLVPVIQGNVIVSASASKGTLAGTNGKVMEVTIGPPAPMAELSLSTPTPVIGPSNTATITATLHDGTGAAMAGRTVTIDTTLVLGTIAPTTGTTNATGKTTFLYTPPAIGKFQNQHLTEVIKASTSVPDTIVGDTQKASLIIFVQNDVTPSWMIVAAAPTSVNGLTLSPISTTARFTVTVTDWAGAPLVGKTVEAVYTDTGNISVAPTSAGSDVTDASGQALFTATETAAAVTGLNNTNALLRFDVKNEVTSTSDEFALLVWDGTSTSYAAWLSFDARTMAFDPTGAQNNVTAHVVSPLGAPVSGVPVFFQIDYGDLGLPAEFNWSYDYATSTYMGAGLDLNSFGQGNLGGSFANSPVIGDPTIGTKWGVENFVEDFEVVGNIGVVDSCDSSTWPAGFAGLYYINATSMTDATGVFTAHFTAMPHKIDSRIQVRAYIGGTPDVVADACNFVAGIENYAFRIDSGVVSQRAPVFALSSLSMSRPILTSQALSVTFTATFKGLNGATVPAPEVILVQGAGSAARNVRGAFGGTMFGSSAGVVTYTRTIGLLSLSQAFSFAFIPADFRYAYGGRDQLFAGAFGDYWFAPTFAALLAKIPFEFKVGYLYLPTTTAFLTVSLDTTLLAPGGTATATVHVWSILTGAAIAGANVWSGSTQNTTDSTGMATLAVTVNSLGATEGLVVATTPYGGAARGWYAAIATNPVVTYSSLSASTKLVGTASTINATVTNTLPVAGTVSVALLVDNKTVAVQSVNLAASGSASVSFSYAFATSGSHYVTVGDQSTTVNVPAQTVVAVDNTLLYALAVGLLVVGLVVGAVVGMMMSRRGKKPGMGMEMSEEPKGENKAEEELAPEDKL